MVIRYSVSVVAFFYALFHSLYLSSVHKVPMYALRTHNKERKAAKKREKKNAIIKSALANLFHLIYRRQCVSVADCMATDHEKFIQRQKSRIFTRLASKQTDEVEKKNRITAPRKRGKKWLKELQVNEERTIKANVRKSKWQRRKEHHSNSNICYAHSYTHASRMGMDHTHTFAVSFSRVLITVLDACPKFIESSNRK